MTDSQLRNWVRGERSTPPDREKVAEWLAALDEVRAREQAVRTLCEKATDSPYLRHPFAEKVLAVLLSATPQEGENRHG